MTTQMQESEELNFTDKRPEHTSCNFLHIKMNEEHEKQFAGIAEILLNNYILHTPKTKYRLVEIEFYYYNQVPINLDDEDFPLYGPPKYEDFLFGGILQKDYFTHRHYRQMKNMYWYLHSNGEHIKQGKRKGLDLTIGNEYEFSYGGILLRGIQNMAESNDYIYGPSTVVERLIQDLDRNNVNEITDVMDIPAGGKGNKIFIEEHKQEKEIVYSCFRHGLKIKENKYPEETEAQKMYIDKEYRFFIYPTKRHSGKEKIVNSWISSSKYPKESILRIFGRKGWKE